MLNDKQICKGFPQVRIKSQRAASHKYFSFHIPSTGQGGDHLKGNRMKYRSRNIFPGYMTA
jgi:hypothetical protein